MPEFKEASYFNEANYAQIHRFHDRVAIYLSTGATVYLTPSEADLISKALSDCAQDVRSVKFTESKFTTFRLNED